jgi:hypothetical protein
MIEILIISAVAAGIDPVSVAAVQLWELLLAGGGVVAVISGGVLGAYKLSLKPTMEATFVAKPECRIVQAELQAKLDKSLTHMHAKQDEALMAIGRLEGILTERWYDDQKNCN